MARWEESGESAAVFAASRVGTTARTLCRWRRDLRKAATLPRAALAKIVEVRPAQLVADVRFEVRLPDGRSVGVPASFDASALERLLRVLAAAR